MPSGEGSIPHFAVYVDDLDKTAADLKAAGVISFTGTGEKSAAEYVRWPTELVLYRPSGEQIELLQML